MHIDYFDCGLECSGKWMWCQKGFWKWPSKEGKPEKKVKILPGGKILEMRKMHGEKHQGMPGDLGWHCRGLVTVSSMKGHSFLPNRHTPAGGLPVGKRVVSLANVMLWGS